MTLFIKVVSTLSVLAKQQTARFLSPSSDAISLPPSRHALNWHRYSFTMVS